MVMSLLKEINERTPLYNRMGRTFILRLPDTDGTMKKVVMPTDSQLFKDFANLRWIGGKESPLAMLRAMGHEI